VKLAGWLIFGVVILPVLFILTASFLGWHFDVVPTKSMEPAFNPGGMVVTRPVELEDITIGDPILFREPATGGLICHRVISIEEVDGELFFRTKGDANEYPDADLVSSQDFIGKVVLYVPHIGNIAYLSRLHETAITVMGQSVSLASLIILAVGLTVIGMEFNNIWEWTSGHKSERREEVLKKRKERLAARKRGFF